MKTATKTSDKFQDTGRLQASVKRPRPAKPVVVPVFVVTSAAGKIIRVTGDTADAERYRQVFAESGRWGKVRIVKRTVQL